MRFWRRRRFDADMDDEMRFHIEMEADRLARSHGLDPREARRRAYVAFGGVEKYKEAARDTRPLQWLDALSLDTRLGVRMLIKHRWLTLVGGFAMAVAIAIGATSFEAASELLDTTLPMPDGDRVVALQLLSGVAIASTGLALSQSIALVVAVAAMMLTVGLFAAFGPARRGLRIEASEALRVDG